MLRSEMMQSRAARPALVSATVLLMLGPVPVRGQAPSIDAVAFLAGCWAGEMGNLEVREQWSEAEGGVMLGTTRYFRDGRLADFEFAMIVEGEEGVTLWPYPGGERSEHGFSLVSSDEGSVFENLLHDFPVRIVYARGGAGELLPRIEGRDGEGRGWRLEPVACPG